VSDSLFFGDKDEKYGIERWKDLTRSPSVLNDFPNFLSYHEPIVVEKICNEAVRSMRFSFWSILKCQVYFFNHDRSHESFIVLLSDFGRDMLIDFSNGRISIAWRFREEILIKGYYLLFQVVVRMESLAFFCN